MWTKDLVNMPFVERQRFSLQSKNQLFEVLGPSIGAHKVSGKVTWLFPLLLSGLVLFRIILFVPFFTVFAYAFMAQQSK